MKLSEIAQPSTEKTVFAPLIWRAIRYATEVEHKRVWSNIPGATGDWSIRYSPDHRKGKEIRGFYVLTKFKVRPNKARTESNWFEIIPEDDDLLEIKPDDNGGYEVYDASHGKFRV